MDSLKGLIKSRILRLKAFEFKDFKVKIRELELGFKVCFLNLTFEFKVYF